MATFEGYERRIEKINKVLAEYGLADLDQAAQFVKDYGVDVDSIVRGVQHTGSKRNSAAACCRRALDEV